MLSPLTKMRRPFQLAYRTCLIPHHSCSFPCLKGQPSLLNSRHKTSSLALSSTHQCLHTSAAVCISKERESLGKASSPPEDTRLKELKDTLSTPTGSIGAQEAPVEPHSEELDPLQDKSISLVQRFKKTFKQYGKVLIPVHLVTSSLWFGAFYYAALKGINVVPFLEFIGLPESIVNILKHSQSGNALTAYAMYKIATPARYTVTLGGTSITVKYLRKHGYMSTPPPVKEYLQDRMEETKERLSGKMEETRDMISGKMEETKERLTGKMEETKERITEKIQETKEKVSFIKKKE
ncbi:protein FAM210A [Hemicordylus capensis]|uniref:protein FAM210A n=1 Tax=Hemicordylus capensis TaxID=884348 RepID=UPI002304281C|nr:protein FAM210A [Hemicordylus capensis]XP_053100045.1 protein FAM210A [Hemicordylus capensis]